jgi:hypothetical protein
VTVLAAIAPLAHFALLLARYGLASVEVFAAGAWLTALASVALLWLRFRGADKTGGPP